jgi:hypothetical protein
MKIEISEQEYALLVDMMNLADWFIHARKVDEQPEDAPYSELYQKIMSYGKNMPAHRKRMKYFEEMEEYEPGETYMMELMARFITDYDDHAFWETMMTELAQRDVIKEEGGEEAYFTLEPEKRWAQEDKFKEQYMNEFAEHGLDNLVIRYKEAMKN